MPLMFNMESSYDFVISTMNEKLTFPTKWIINWICNYKLNYNDQLFIYVLANLVIFWQNFNDHFLLASRAHFNIWFQTLLSNLICDNKSAPIYENVGYRWESKKCKEHVWVTITSSLSNLSLRLAHTKKCC